MPFPLTPIPGRPVDDAIVETAWGEWVHDCLLAAPRGVVGYAEKLTDSAQGVILTIPPFTLPAGRRLLITGFAQTYSTVAGDDVRTYLRDAANAVTYQYHQDSINRPSQPVGAALHASLVTTGAATGFVLTVVRGNGSGTLTVQGSASPTILLAQDLGAV
jgi:hypothetical protein